MENEIQDLKILIADLIGLVDQLSTEVASLIKTQPNIQKGYYPEVCKPADEILAKAKLVRASADKLLPKRSY